MAVKMVEIDGFRMLVVDDFYRNPEHLRDYFLKSPAPLWKTAAAGRNQIDYWDCRHQHKMDCDAYVRAQRCIAAMARYYLGAVVSSPIDDLSTNLLRLQTTRSGQSASVVHHDGDCLAALVCLNLPEECNGGTGFFRNRFNGVFNIGRLSRLEMKALDDWCDRNDLLEDGRSYFLENWTKWWDLEYLAEMRFNRLLIYPGAIFHAAFFEGAPFTKVPRLNHMMFFSDVQFPRQIEWLKPDEEMV
jgi:hypothetical protein